MDIVPADSHVGEIERSDRTLKERTRSCVHGLPFKRLPKLMVTHIVKDAVRCLNQFPWSNGISEDTMGPDTLLTGSPPPDFNRMRLKFGSYVQVFEDNDPSKTLRARSTGAIALTPTGNFNGNYNFMSLVTGALISRHSWTELPISDTAIARVEANAKNENQPLIQDSGLVIKWRPDHPIDDDEDDFDYALPPNPVVDDDNFYDDDINADELLDLDIDAPQAAPALVPLPVQGADFVDDDVFEDDEVIEEEEHEEVFQHEHDEAAPADEFLHIVDHDEEEKGANVNQDPVNGDDDMVVEGADVDQDAPNGNDMAVEGAQGAEVFDIEDNNDVVEIEIPVIEEAAIPKYNMRQRTNSAPGGFKQAIHEPHDSKSYYPPTQLAQLAAIKTNPTKKAATFTFAHVLTQMSARAGLRKHGQAAKEALMDEFAQLEDLSVYEPVDATTLTKAQRTATLRAINLIKEKRSGKLKGRTVADGRSQRN